MGNSVLCVGNGVCHPHHNQRKANGAVEDVESIEYSHPEWEEYKKRTNTILPIRFFMHFFEKSKSDSCVCWIVYGTLIGDEKIKSSELCYHCNVTKREILLVIYAVMNSTSIGIHVFEDKRKVYNMICNSFSSYCEYILLNRWLLLYEETVMHFEFGKS